MPPRFTTCDPAAHHLDSAIDALVQARLSLGGPATWSPPTLSLLTATEDDPEWRRHEARLKEVLARLEGLSPDLHEHLYELKRAALDLAERAGQVGWSLGLSVVVERRDTAPEAESGDGPGNVPNRES